MQQALRRPLRLTQKYPVDAYYLVYRDTMESAAVALIMEKMAAAEKVNGNSLEASLMASQASADDVLSQLGKVLQGTANVKDLRALFYEKEREANEKRVQKIEGRRQMNTGTVDVVFEVVEVLSAHQSTLF